MYDRLNDSVTIHKRFMDSPGAFGRYYRVDAADVLDIRLICLYAEETSFFSQHSIYAETRQLIFFISTLDSRHTLFFCYIYSIMAEEIIIRRKYIFLLFFF